MEKFVYSNFYYPGFMLKYILLLLLTTAVCGQDFSHYYYYTGKEYGSESQYNPVSLILNGSFDILQLQPAMRDVRTIDFATGTTNVWRNLSDPFTNINKYGWWKFLRREVFPLDWSKQGKQWWPNYQLHLIGGGMEYRAMAEYFDYHGYPYPKTFSVLTMAAFQLLNEITENNSTVGTNVDPISDFWIFDIGGVLLFSNEEVCRFFSEDLNLADWSLQPGLTVPGWKVHNVGQNFSIKVKTPLSEKIRFFYYCGLNGLTGASLPTGPETNLSIGIGLRAKNQINIDNMNEKSVETVWNVGLFYDRNNSLLASLFLSGMTDYFITANVYPGFVELGKIKPGLWLVLKQNGSSIIGISTNYVFNIGVDTER
ncbi:MAG: hypothetical protein LWX56_02270 [Ignavibacteria bacterium]|nr:hypothetical protein [Ignavibacteria bacterium]